MKWLKSLTKCFLPVPDMFGGLSLFLPTVRHQTEDGKYPLLALEGSDVHLQQWEKEDFSSYRQILPAALQMFVDELCVKSTVSRVVPTRNLHHPQLIWDTRSYCVKSCSILEFCSQSLFRNNSHWYFIPSSMNHITPNEQKIQKARPDDVILFQAQNSQRAGVTSSSLTLVKWPF